MELLWHIQILWIIWYGGTGCQEKFLFKVNICCFLTLPHYTNFQKSIIFSDYDDILAKVIPIFISCLKTWQPVLPYHTILSILSEKNQLRSILSFYYWHFLIMFNSLCCLQWCRIFGSSSLHQFSKSNIYLILIFRQKYLQF